MSLIITQTSIALELDRLFVLTDFFVSLGFYLADSFSSYAELLSHFFQSVRYAVGESMSHFQNFALFFREFRQNFYHLIFENSAGGLLVGRKQFIVRDKIAER